jgi:hypothetical protein
MSMQNPGSHKVPTAFEKLLGEYEKLGQDFEILTHPYFSTGAFPFVVVNSVADANGFTRLVLKCARNTKVELFSYAIDDNGEGANLAPGTPTDPIAATDAETNILERHRTNEEDFAIEGISVSARGCRIAYPAIGANIFTNPALHSVLQNGDVTIKDVGSQILPPELSSPLNLEDALFSALRGKVSVVPTFNRKATDHIARFDKFPEGGANSYLLANGEPSVHNYFRLHEGFVWRQSGAETDKLFSLRITMEDDCYFTATLPNLFQSTIPASSLGAPIAIWWEFTMFLHGRAFYIPSKNI